MKVTLDLDKLLDSGRITKEEYVRLAEISRQDTKVHAFSVLIVLAAIAVAVGFVGINPKFFFELVRSVYNALGNNGLYAAAVFLLIGGGVATRSGFLVGMSSLVILSWLGGSTLYSHAAYFIAIREPAPTIIVFSLLSLAGLAISRELKWDLQRLALIFARTCLFIVNMGFWIGSLWGSTYSGGALPDYCFAVVWAVALVAVGTWGAKEGRLFVVNICSVFGSIHFYTQWFERLGASPESLLMAGMMALLITYQLRRYNIKARRPPTPPLQEKTDVEGAKS